MPRRVVLSEVVSVRLFRADEPPSLLKAPRVNALRRGVARRVCVLERLFDYFFRP